jgi:hypothetical protein
MLPLQDAMSIHALVFAVRKFGRELHGLALEVRPVPCTLHRKPL